MNLAALRALFAQHGGRSDLVNPNGSDNGANFFINSGQRWLDRTYRFPKDLAHHFITMAANDYFVEIPRARAIKEVWLYDSTSIARLEKVSERDLREYYAKPFDQLDSGTPLYYATIGVRGMITPPPGGVGSFELIVADDEITGLLIMPPSSAAMHLDVQGLFYSTELTIDASTSFWSDQEPNVLIMAAMRECEIMYRNTEGVKDWTKAIEDALVPIDKDVVEQDITDISEMEG